MAGSSRARWLSYGSLGGSLLGDAEYRATTSDPTRLEARQKQHWSWLRVGIASIAAVAGLGLLSASRLTSSSSSSAFAEVDAPQVMGTTGSQGEEDLTFVASNEYTRRGDVVGRGYPWLQVRMYRCHSTNRKPSIRRASWAVRRIQCAHTKSHVCMSCVRRAGPSSRTALKCV